MAKLETDSKLVQDYAFGFTTEIEDDQIPMGLNEEIIRMISDKKNEPDWMREFRLKAFRHWLGMTEPKWAFLDYPKIDFRSRFRPMCKVVG